VKLVLQIHDELLFEVPNDVDAEAFEKEVKTCMENPDILRDFIGESFKVPMRADSGIGPHWGAL
jgi:DNA polymerase I-like protein with 3'-5' exonuclease and polymerase domains